MDRQIRSAIVLVVDDPKCVPTCLVEEALKVDKPTKEMSDYIVRAVERFLDASALLLSLKVGTSKADILRDFGLLSESVLCGLVYLGMIGALEKSVKNFTAWPEARCLGEVLPPESSGIHYRHLLGNGVRKFINARVLNGKLGKMPSRATVKLCTSLLFLKDSMVDVPPEFVESSFRDYEATLSALPPSEEEKFQRWRKGGGEKEYEQHELLRSLNQEPEVTGPVRSEYDRIVDESRERYRSLLDRLEESIVKTVREVFRPARPCDYNDDDVIPSVSSSFANSRGLGGAWNELLAESGDDDRTVKSADLLQICYSPVHGMVEVYGFIVHLSGEFTYERRVSARVVPILEACKVRWVSIGEAKAYFRAKAWNRLVYQQLPNHKTFALIGRPLCVDDVNDMVHTYLLSGDYKGATDTLDPYWSELVFEEITKVIYARDQGYGWATRVVGLRSMLTKHSMSYTDSRTKTVRTFDQHTGQLMGSFLSFPILCVLNAAVNRLYLDPSLQKPIAELPLLVNGDDVMMSSSEPFDGWANHVGLVGLTPSLGKNYVHTHVVCLNSEFYLRETPNSTFERIHPWKINLIYGQDSDADGGLFGQHVSRPEHLQLSTLGAMARTMVAHQTDEDKEKLLSEFIRNNSKTLKSTQRCWWTPEELGGVGLPLSPATIGRVNDDGRLVASYLMSRVLPEDALGYAAHGSPVFTFACRQWMSDCNRLYPVKGYTYRWLTDSEVSAPPPVQLKNYIGLGAAPQKAEYIENYRDLFKKVLKAKNFLTPCSDETLLKFAAKPRRAGWVRGDPSENLTIDDTDCTLTTSDVVVACGTEQSPIGSDRV